MFGNDNYDLLWQGVSGDHERVQKQASLTHAKVAVAQYWPFLSRSVDEQDFENRLSLTLERIAARVPAETYDDVISSLRDDFRALAAGKGENPFAKDDDSDNDEADNDDKDSKKSDDDSDSDDDDDDSDDKDSGSDSDSKSDSSDDDDSDSKKSNPFAKKDDSKSDSKDDDSDSGVDHAKPDFLRGKKSSKQATNYRPDPTAGWRYHPGYEQLRQPVNNGDLQDGDGFVADLAQGEGRANEVIEQRQLTPGVWTQHDGMPERPMPQGVQRGYMPVNAGLEAEAGMDFRKMIDGSTAPERPLDPYYNEIPEIRGTSRTKGTFDGPTGRELADVEKLKSHQSVLFDRDGFVVQATNPYIKQQGGSWVILQKGTGKVLSHHDSKDKAESSFAAMEMNKHSNLTFDAQGFVVEASEGRGVDPLQDPAPGTPQRHNQFYFQDGSNVGGNAGFPVDPGPEPHPNNMDEIYGDVAPQQSSGSTEGQVDGDGYSRLGFNRSAASYVNTPEPEKGSKQACSQCGGQGYLDASQWGEPRGTMHPCYRCGTTGVEDAHGEWEGHEFNRGFEHGGEGMAPEEHASAPYLEGHGAGYHENRFSHYPDDYRVKRDGQEDYHSPGAQQHYRDAEEYGDYDYRAPYRQASLRYDAEGFLVESPNFT